MVFRSVRSGGRWRKEEEDSKVAAHSFMSEAGCFYLGSVGLLGEYCPTTRKRHKLVVRGSGRPSLLHAAQLASGRRLRVTVGACSVS